MGRRPSPGLCKRGGTWHIQKQIKGYGSLYESCGTSDLGEAERYLARRLDQIREQTRYGIVPQRTWRQAATKYLEETIKRSLGRDAQSLMILDPYIGELAVDEVHMDTLHTFIQARRTQGIKSRTVNRDLAVVRRVLNLAARKWRNESQKPWITTAPLIEMQDWEDGREPWPISWEEQQKFFKELPDHLHRMALYKVNTGCRQEEVCGLQWDWEVTLPELNTFVFYLPGRPLVADGWPGTKNKEDRIVVPNRIARSVVDSQRGVHPKYVFTYRGEHVARMTNHAWRKAAIRAGLNGFHVHDLKHTCGRRLRASGVPLETRKVLLGHTNGDITTHYSMPEIEELFDAMERIADDKSGKSRATMILKRRSGTA